MSKEKAIEIVKNLTETINKMENQRGTVGYLTRDDMFSAPTASKHKLSHKRKKIIKDYNLKEKKWK